MTEPHKALPKEAAHLRVTLTKPLRVAVLGLGLIGGSVALGILAYARTGQSPQAQVVGWDPDPQTRAAAAARSVQVTQSAIAAVRDADLVVLCGPLKTLAATAHEIAPHLLDHAIITDVGSVKASVRQALSGAGLNDRYVGAHPMAGLEQSGFLAASAQLLNGATWALTVDAETTAGNFLTVLRFVITVFAARVIVLDDHSHDSAAAIISHVPHVLAHELLGHATASPHTVIAQRLAAGSFRDGTRVARVNPGRNQAMVEDNRLAVASALRSIVEDLSQLVAKLETGAESTDFFNRGAQWDPHRNLACQEVTWDPENWREQALELGSEGALITGIAVDSPEPGTVLLTVARG